MTYNHTEENDDFDFELDDEPVDEFHELASMFARLSASDSVPAKRRRMYERLSDLCDRVGLAEGQQRDARVNAVHMSLAQLEKTVRAETRARPRH